MQRPVPHPEAWTAGAEEAEQLGSTEQSCGQWRVKRCYGNSEVSTPVWLVRRVSGVSQCQDLFLLFVLIFFLFSIALGSCVYSIFASLLKLIITFYSFFLFAGGKAL